MAAELATSLTATEAERLEQAEALVRGYCGWHIAPERDDTVTLRASYGRDLFLPSLYVTSVDSVTDDGAALTVEDDYRWTQSGVLSRCFWSDTEVVVEFTHGYEEVPADVTAVVQAIAARMVSNPRNLKRETSGPFTEEFDGTLNSSERERLIPYRISVVA